MNNFFQTIKQNVEDFCARLFAGRHGMDDLSKFLFWFGLFGLVFGALLRPVALLSRLLEWASIAALVICFVRALSRNTALREMENSRYLAQKNKLQYEQAQRKNRWEQRKSYRFYKCPGCGTWIRVPRGKGKIHINCKCGYTLYRKS